MTERIYPNGVAALYSLLFPNGKRYIGISTNPRKRMRLHKALALRGSQNLVHRALRKFGVGTIHPQTLVVGPRDYILELERTAIAAFGTQDPAKGYNLSAGGEANPMDVPEAKAKMIRALTGRKRPDALIEQQKRAWTPDKRAIISAIHKGKEISIDHKRAVGRIWDAKGERKTHGTTHKSKWTPERMDNAEALLIWRDLSITIAQALTRMTGWSHGCAYRVLGRRTSDA